MTLMLLAVSWLLTYLVHSTLLIGAACVASGIGLARGHGARDLMWKAAIVGGLLTATVQLSLPAHPSPARLALSADSAAPTVEALGTLALAAPVAPAAPAPPARRAMGVATVASTASVASAPGARRLGSFHAAWPGMLLELWLFGALACLTGLALTSRAVHRRLADRTDVTDARVVGMLEDLRARAGVTTPVRLTMSRRLSGPISFGAAEICLPERALTELGPDELRAVLAHELGHVVRGDSRWRVVSAVIAAALFLQPLNRLARRRLHEVAEYLCDDWAAARTDGGLALARCLAEVATWIKPAPELALVSGMASRPSQLVARVERLLAGRPVESRHGRVAAGVVAVAALGLVAWSAPGVETGRLAPPARPARASEAAAIADVPDAAWPTVAAVDSDAWLAVRDNGRLLVLSAGYSARLTGQGPLRFREWGREIRLPDGYTVTVGGLSIAGDRDVTTSQRVRIVAPDGSVAWTLDPVRVERRTDAGVAEGGRRDDDWQRDAARRESERAADAKLDAAIDTVVEAWARDPAAVRAAAARIAATFDRDLEPQFESLGVALGRDMAPRLERVSNRMDRDLSPEFARMGAELGRSIAAALGDAGDAIDADRVGSGDYREKSKPKQP